MDEYTNIEEVEEKFTQDYVKKYPVVLRIRVSEVEENVIMAWLKMRRLK